MKVHMYGLSEDQSLLDIHTGVRLINYTDNHQKYWTIRYDILKRLLIREWGRIGNAPQRKEETYSLTEALNKSDKLIFEKYEKGYRTEAENLKFLLNKS